MRPEPLLEVKHLKKYYELKKGWFSPKQQVKAVDDVSFTVYRGETYGLVGESRWSSRTRTLRSTRRKRSCKF